MSQPSDVVLFGMTNNQIMGLVRQLVQSVGTLAASLGWATHDAVGLYGAVVITVVGFTLSVVGAVLSLVADSKRSILIAASQMPEVQQGRSPIVLAPANSTPEAKREVAELVAATPVNVIASLKV